MRDKGGSPVHDICPRHICLTYSTQRPLKRGVGVAGGGEGGVVAGAGGGGDVVAAGGLYGVSGQGVEQCGPLRVVRSVAQSGLRCPPSGGDICTGGRGGGRGGGGCGKFNDGSLYCRVFVLTLIPRMLLMVRMMLPCCR